MERASLVIPVFNKLEYTQKCIDSLLADSDRPAYEIIVIDNGSSDGSGQYLRAKAEELKNAGSNDVLVPIINEQNLGVAPAWNQGVRRASHEIVGVLNNDIVVTTGWFRALVWAIKHHSLDLVSPFASTGKLDYDLVGRASAFVRKNRSKLWSDYDFCAVVFPKKTFTVIGEFDENFKVGGYEDTDYCYRLREKGMSYGVSGAAFIHHFGSSTLGDFKKLGDKHVPHNLNYFISKWKKDPSEGISTVSAKLARSWKKLKLHFDLM